MGVRQKLTGLFRRRPRAMGAAGRRLVARLRRSRARGPVATAALGAGAVIVLFGLIAAGIAVLAPGDEATATGGRVAAGVPLPSTGDAPAGRLDAPADAPVETPVDAVAAAEPQPGVGLTVPAATAAAFAHVPPVREVVPLAEAADPALLETTDDGLVLPRIAADGRVPWRAYARPFDRADDRPRVVVVIAGLGLAAAATDAAIDRLPGAVSLAFDPVAAGLAAQTGAARRFGHETLAMLPLESTDFPFEDLGPGALKAAAGEADALRRLDAVLAAAPASVGVLAVGGSRFARAVDVVRPVLQAIAGRGLLLCDATGDGAGLLSADAARLDVPRVLVDAVIDEAVDADAIDARLAALEALAHRRHVAVGLGRPLPVTLGRVRAWIDTLPAKGLVLAPVSAVVGTQIPHRCRGRRRRAMTRGDEPPARAGA